MAWCYPRISKSRHRTRVADMNRCILSSRRTKGNIQASYRASFAWSSRTFEADDISIMYIIEAFSGFMDSNVVS